MHGHPTPSPDVVFVISAVIIVLYTLYILSVFSFKVTGLNPDPSSCMRMHVCACVGASVCIISSAHTSALCKLCTPLCL